MGSPISFGSPCVHNLDNASVWSLFQLGVEPLAAANLSPTGEASWIFSVPQDPAYAGFVAGLQAIVVSPSGTIPLGAGLFGQTSNALQLTLGY